LGYFSWVYVRHFDTRFRCALGMRGCRPFVMTCFFELDWFLISYVCGLKIPLTLAMAKVPIYFEANMSLLGAWDRGEL